MRAEKVKSRLSTLSEEKLKKRLDDQYAELSRAWVKHGTVDPTEENAQKWKDEAYPTVITRLSNCDHFSFCKSYCLSSQNPCSRVLSTVGGNSNCWPHSFFQLQW